MAEEFIIRFATTDDMKNVFELSNDKLVRKNSINQEQIGWDDHVVWFTNRITKIGEPFYIVESYDKKLIAQVRFDKRDEFVISLSVSSGFRGKGLAAKIIKKCSEFSGINKITAWVKEENTASQKAFLKAGYKFDIKDGDYLKYVYKKSVYIIAEMSANHCGDIELAKKIISKAKEIGADAVKIQTYTADTITINCNNAEFQIKDQNSLWKGENLYSLYQKAYTPWEWQGELKTYADCVGIDFFSTPFDFTAVDFLESIKVPMYKIASFEAIDYPLVKYAASKGKPMIISTGISSFEEMQEVVDVCHSVGNDDITLLKCTSAYPARPEDMNILTVKDMMERFSLQGVKIGLSDHSMSIIPPVAAVALGARVIEKHFTLDRALGGADSAFSLNIEEFAAMVKAVRETEKTLGAVDYTVNEQNRKFARSLYVVKDIKQGEVFTFENIKSIRPANGLHPKYYNEVLGKKAACDLTFGTALQKKHIKD